MANNSNRDDALRTREVVPSVVEGRVWKAGVGFANIRVDTDSEADAAGAQAPEICRSHALSPLSSHSNASSSPPGSPPSLRGSHIMRRNVGSKHRTAPFPFVKSASLNSLNSDNPSKTIPATEEHEEPSLEPACEDDAEEEEEVLVEPNCLSTEDTTLTLVAAVAAVIGAGGGAVAARRGTRVAPLTMVSSWQIFNLWEAAADGEAPTTTDVAVAAAIAITHLSLENAAMSPRSLQRSYLSALLWGAAEEETHYDPAEHAPIAACYCLLAIAAASEMEPPIERGFLSLIWGGPSVAPSEGVTPPPSVKGRHSTAEHFLREDSLNSPMSPTEWLSAMSSLESTVEASNDDDSNAGWMQSFLNLPSALWKHEAVIDTPSVPFEPLSIDTIFPEFELLGHMPVSPRRQRPRQSVAKILDATRATLNAEKYRSDPIAKILKQPIRMRAAEGAYGVLVEDFSEGRQRILKDELWTYNKMVSLCKQMATLFPTEAAQRDALTATRKSFMEVTADSCVQGRALIVLQEQERMDRQIGSFLCEEGAVRAEHCEAEHTAFNTLTENIPEAVSLAQRRCHVQKRIAFLKENICVGEYTVKQCEGAIQRCRATVTEDRAMWTAERAEREDMIRTRFFSEEGKAGGTYADVFDLRYMNHLHQTTEEERHAHIADATTRLLRAQENLDALKNALSVYSAELSALTDSADSPCDDKDMHDKDLTRK